jgi:small subunit ribosomal protein S2
MAANLHLGHAASHRNMLTYIYGKRGGINIINLDYTLQALRRAARIVQYCASQNGNILFVGTKPMLHKITHDAAIRGNCYFALKWVGGTITNRFRVLRRSVNYNPDTALVFAAYSDKKTA